MKRAATKGRRTRYFVIPLKNIGEHPEFIKLVREAEADLAAGRTISHEEMKRRLPGAPLRKKRSRSTRKPGR